MKTIPLKQGKLAIVDNEDYEWLKLYKWHLSNGYATRSFSVNKNIKGITMHLEILKKYKKYFLLKRGLETDHINNNRLDNRKINLRLVTHLFNINNEPIKTNNTSGIIGVYWVNKTKKWCAQISLNKKCLSLGSFKNKNDAIIARKIAQENKIKNLELGSIYLK